MSDEQGTWLYAVAGDLGRGGLPPLTGVAEEPLRTVEAGGLVAVVGSVPLSSFGDEALRRNLEDLDWLARVARAHDNVVDAVARAGPAVPLRLATVYLDDERVEQVLRKRAADFERTLGRVAGRREWGVKALLEREPERQPAATSGGPSRPGAGAAYLKRKREQHQTRQRHEQLAAEEAGHIYAVLAERAVDARRHRPQSQQLSGAQSPMILNAAYLVDSAAEREFTRAVAVLDSEHESVRLQLTGPWPPYSFSELEDNDE
ncbi:GvpL/GvpF family gas vesicle protein [Amycolatopsis taiwanensis]|uniref:Gas vesicle protein n=1 Tax=Amycolatopsis taiwanensis TaxID=342230 RepID=A0A9W6QW22_9PSEU|nr:GvpL/GvpF family gas vesicle protein [Amycolatopsis taiwanensis]GLY65134.1 gas vesicle protein [Amycolatopsis taiwanensis]